MKIKTAFVSPVAAFWTELKKKKTDWFAVVCWIPPLVILQEQNIV